MKDSQTSLSKHLSQEFRELKSKREIWNSHWQTISQYVFGDRLNINEKNPDGARLNEKLYTSDGAFAAHSLSSALIGALWPSASQSIKLIPPRDLPGTQQNKEYLEEVTEIVADAMDDPMARFSVSQDEYMLEQVSFGTSGLGIFPGDESLVRYEPWSAYQLYIDEGLDGQVDTIYRQFSYTLRRAIATYGLENLSKRLQDASKNIARLGEEVKLLHIIKKRSDRDITRPNAQNMPYMSVHMEEESSEIIRESGFIENPVNVTRFRKLAYEIYGRSPGMAALSDILEQDWLTERFTVNVDKSGDPPLMVNDDGSMGGGYIDTSAGGITVVSTSGRANNGRPAIEPIFTVGELSHVLERITMLRGNISQHFFLDKLLDFNNQTTMTATETVERAQIRAAAVGSLFSRQIAENYTPAVTRTFNILLRNGHLGVIEGSQQHLEAQLSGEKVLVIPPDIAKLMANGKEVYKIKYFTPAARMLSSEQFSSLAGMTTFVQTVMQSHPEAGDLLDVDEAVKSAAEYLGQEELIRSEEQYLQIRDSRAKQMEQQQQMEQLQQGASAIQDLSQAQQTL